MKYFLDSAKMDEINYAYENYGIDGVTTNPKHIMASGQPFMTAVTKLADFAKDKPTFPISIEINPHLTQATEMVAMAKEIQQHAANFVIKIPCTEQGLIAARQLEQMGVRTNVTLIFSAAQAIMPAKLGAKYASPFVNWKELNGEDGMGYVKDIAQIYRQYHYDTEIIVAAVRSGHQLVEAALAGADIVTAALDIYQESFSHPYTDLGLKRFQDAWDATPKEV